jgi:C-terminal processing protease CtpA/Prc
MNEPVGRIVSLVSAALLLGACGGGGGDAGGTPTPPASTGTAQIYGIVNTFFGNQLVGTTSAPQSITLTSSGTAPLVISSVTVTGPFAAGGTCGGTVAVGATCTLTVTFTPTAVGAVAGVVTIASNAPGPAYTISIGATGYVASGWVQGQFPASRTKAARCAAPRPGTSDQPGSAVDERNWLRSWTNELYLWYDEVPDRDPGLYGTNAAYFDVLKSPSKDKFHFTYLTSDWIALSQTGVSAGYGATFVLLARTPPRNALVAYTEPGSPAAAIGITRGAKVLTVDGADLVNANDQPSIDRLNAGLFPAAAGETHTFSILDPGATTARTVTLVSANVTSVPVQNTKTLATASGSVGYLLFNDHIATSEAALVTAFTALKNAGVGDLVLDIRYNGGGYLDVASEVAFMIAGPAATTGRTFEVMQFNAKHPTVNPVTSQPIVPIDFHATTQGFSLAPGQALPTLNLPRVFILTGTGTCSASESIINSLRGVDLQVIQIGSTTCGKPYGFYPTDNCGTTYFSIQFKGVNAKGFGDYLNGFSPANTATGPGIAVPGCSVADDFAHALGDPLEGRLAAALSYRTAGSCTTPPSGVMKLQATIDAGYVPPAGDGVVIKSPWQENRIVRD